MKNIHLIATDKPTGIFQSNSGLQFSIRDKVRVEPLKGFHIYITSDEDINENDYIITKDGRLVQVSYLLSKDLEEASKVILTTDQDLIKDGVQAIDDEFLEWFVKNPSCESVETYSLGIENSDTGESGHYKYEIIIQQEEQTKCYCGHTSYCDCGPQEEPKQDTMKTAVEFLVEEINKLTGLTIAMDEPCVEQAIKMEKEQIMNAYKAAEDKYEFFEYEHRYGREYLTAEPYYNETFKPE